jgi:glycosyltransferase involved in cell wall biosynthesis
LVYLLESPLTRHHPGALLSKVKILVTSTFVTPFIIEDLNTLRKHWEVEHLLVRGAGAVASIVRGVRRNDIVYTWFASTYAAAAVASARTFRRRSVIAIGGADVAGIDEIGYGIWISPWKSHLVSYALRMADRVLAVDPFLKEEAIRRVGYDGRNIECLPTGYDSAFWSPGGERTDSVLTVAVCDSEARLRVKGVDLLLDTARCLPATKFLLVGVQEPHAGALRTRAPANIEIRGRVSREELLDLYRGSKVYCQPSRFEGLPNSVCEAMLCGCVPVCSDVGGMRTPVSGHGFLVPWGDAGTLAAAIMEAMASPPAAGLRGRESIASRFTLGRREQGLMKMIGELAG